MREEVFILDDLSPNDWIVFTDIQHHFMENPKYYQNINVGTPFYILAIDFPWIIGHYCSSPMTTVILNLNNVYGGKPNKAFLKQCIDASVFTVAYSNMRDHINELPEWLQKSYLRKMKHEKTN